MPDIEFSSSEVARVFEMDAGTVMNLTNRGIVEADSRSASGPGSRRAYTFRNLVEFGIVLVHRKLGVPDRMAKLTLNDLASRGFWDSAADSACRVFFDVASVLHLEEDRREILLKHWGIADGSVPDYSVSQPMVVMKSTEEEVDESLVPFMRGALGKMEIYPHAVYADTEYRCRRAGLL